MHRVAIIGGRGAGAGDALIAAKAMFWRQRVSIKLQDQPDRTIKAVARAGDLT